MLCCPSVRKCIKGKGLSTIVPATSIAALLSRPFWHVPDKGAPATFDETTRSTHGLVNSSPDQLDALDSFDFDEAGVVSCLQMGALSL